MLSLRGKVAAPAAWRATRAGARDKLGCTASRKRRGQAALRQTYEYTPTIAQAGKAAPTETAWDHAGVHRLLGPVDRLVRLGAGLPVRRSGHHRLRRGPEGFWLYRRHRCAAVRAAALVEAPPAGCRVRRRNQRGAPAARAGRLERRWWDWDIRKNSIYYSPRWWDMLGYRPNELQVDSRWWLRLLPPEDADDVLAHIERLLAGTNTGGRMEVRLRHKDGHYVPILTRFRIQRSASGKPLCVSGTNTDLTDVKSAERRLHQAAAVFETTREGILVTDAQSRIVMINQAFTANTGYSEPELLGRTPTLLSSGLHTPAFYHAMWQALATDGYWRGEVCNRNKDGALHPEFLSISAVKGDKGKVINYVAVYADVSKIRESERKLDFLAHHDPLTGLPNRLMLAGELDHAIKAAQRDQTSFALLLLDLDRFKDVNDSYGHAAGDELLKQVAACLRRRLREVDVVARLGGDEFVVVLENVAHSEDAGRVASEIAEWLSQGWSLPNGAEVRIGVSIGISIFPAHGHDSNELIQHADAAMYLAKQQGSGCFRYFSQRLTQDARERLELEARLHQAVQRNQLRAYFQPQIDIASGKLIGAEALVRWEDPERGLIAPDRFIPVAEASGLINEIGKWILWQSCMQGQRWIEAGFAPIIVAVNVSPRQFQNSDVRALVRQVLEETGFPAQYLELELTESALMERGDEAMAALNGLRELGVHLAIDDFGTGYSSLAYLKHFPLDVLKIDRSFVKDIPRYPDDVAIATAIITMGHTLGFKVLAEGVESEEQRLFLAERGCDMYQGYLKSRPVPAEVFERMFAPAMAVP
ncbi:MAG: putative bifunctional diguanylate cyclase/phosphodiesterase [Telluria sp.]